MNVEYINPFIQSVTEFFTSMLGAQVDFMTIARTDPAIDETKINAFIGLSGAVVATVVISLPLGTAQNLVRSFVSINEMPDAETLRDGVAEAVNIIAGSAKTRLPMAQHGGISLSLPTVISGTQISIEYPKNAVLVEVPFESNLGVFSLRVAFKDLTTD